MQDSGSNKERPYGVTPMLGRMGQASLPKGISYRGTIHPSAFIYGKGSLVLV
jgi:hypothetical protein